MDDADLDDADFDDTDLDDAELYDSDDFDDDAEDLVGDAMEPNGLMSGMTQNQPFEDRVKCLSCNAF